jgi:hypothetical protein
MSNIKKFFLILKSQSLTPISSDPYSTHIPILIGLSIAHRVKKVVEYGSGFNSTFLFLNHDVFSSLTKIDSYENYPEWYEKVKAELKSDLVNYVFVDGLMANSVRSDDIDSSDLVFIDDSYTAHERALTIDSVIKFNPKMCVIHDFENIQYRWCCIKSNIKYYRFKSILPNVGVFGSSVNMETCSKIDSIVSLNSPAVHNKDVARWLTIFKNELLK